MLADTKRPGDEVDIVRVYWLEKNCEHLFREKYFSRNEEEEL